VLRGRQSSRPDHVAAGRDAVDACVRVQELLGLRAGQGGTFNSPNWHANSGIVADGRAAVVGVDLRGRRARTAGRRLA